MSYQDLQRMEPKYYGDSLVRELWDIIDDPSIEMFGLYECSGHGDVHYAQSENDLLQRLLHEHVPAASCFASSEAARELIAFAVIRMTPQYPSL